MLKFYASTLIGGNDEQYFTILTGGGANSKSMLVQSLEGMYGPAFLIKINVGVISSKTSSGSGPTPELARAKNVRVAVFQEPEADEPLRNRIIKETSGGDSFFARMLHDNGGDVEMTFKSMMVSNTIPMFLNPDPAVQRRVLVAPHESTWSRDAPKDEAEQWQRRLFELDPGFKTTAKLLSPALLWVLVGYYNDYYAIEGLTPPQIMTEHTANYWNDTDIYRQFAQENLSVAKLPDGTIDTNSIVSITEMYQVFSRWYNNNFKGSRTTQPQRRDVKIGIERFFNAKASPGGWCGIKINEDVTVMDLTQTLMGKQGGKPKLILPGMNGKTVSPSGLPIPKELAGLKDQSSSSYTTSPLDAPVGDAERLTCQTYGLTGKPSMPALPGKGLPSSYVPIPPPSAAVPTQPLVEPAFMNAGQAGILAC